MTGNKKDIKEAAAFIRAGKLVAFPTETVYGLGANALDPLAVAKIYELKERPSFDPLIVHVDSIARAETLTTFRNKMMYTLAEAFWPGPLTLVVPKSDVVPDIVSSGLPTVGIRMPDHPIALELIREADRPLAAPSANKFGRISPTRAWHVDRYLPGVDKVLDGGITRVGIESTIVALQEDGFRLLRPGAITRNDLLRLVPEAPELPGSSITEAPGMMDSHYSPVIPFMLSTPELIQSIDPERTGYIGLSGPAPAPFKEVRLLAEDGDLSKYAAGLFGAMHDLQHAGLELIIAEPVPKEGIGVAIMDRLLKASFGHSSPFGK
ncbi:translation factor SUA5 [Robiginitalea myxolifaciens]|uniref:Threonylcarbamoyl-AMP synthase n=1 Tax=Robiginitalea myxolifaciens TaxID=400055 RepID=A0A1I6FUH3_9FLAO|nr:L-threonylcarbamoyladenylate synthase [Robiginitalea myxolifaciens]SFR33602.1 translation factor SUA5 [Robiginitalea myxolifaciens]